MAISGGRGIIVDGKPFQYKVKNVMGQIQVVLHNPENGKYETKQYDECTITPRFVEQIIKECKREGKL